jgi:hypothetical protein
MLRYRLLVDQAEPLLLPPFVNRQGWFAFMFHDLDLRRIAEGPNPKNSFWTKRNFS